MPTPEARRRRRAWATLAVVVTTVNFYSLWRIQDFVGDLRKLSEAQDQTCRDRAIARNVLRTVILHDPDTSGDDAYRIATDFQDIPCP